MNELSHEDRKHIRRHIWLAAILLTAGLVTMIAGGVVLFVVVTGHVAGLAGVGKTALAVQAGHAARAAGWFPGGVLFIDLHGYDDAPVQPGQALDSLLPRADWVYGRPNASIGSGPSSSAAAFVTADVMRSASKTNVS